MSNIAQELLPVLGALSKMTEDELQDLGLTIEDCQAVELLADPVKWASAYLGWEAREYQKTMLEQGAKRNRLVLRLGRRLGKTECMAVLILWHAFTQINRDREKASTDPYDILILAPAENQVELIFDRLVELIENSPEFKNSIKRKVYLRLELRNNTHIQLMTLGTANSSGAVSVRGQRADLLVYDEADYLGSDEIANTLQIANEDMLRIKVLAASTPSGDRREFYDWCVGASHSYEADVDLVAETGEIKYKYINRPGRDGNGWSHIYAPSTVNRKLYEVNPDTGLTGMESLKEEFNEAKFEQEVMANFGESANGVYQKRYIDLAVEKGAKLGAVYAGDDRGVRPRDFDKMGPRILGVDWDHSGAPTNMVGMHFVEKYGTFVPFARVEIPQNEYTYDLAVKMIIKLNEVYNFDWIFCDAGHGEFQIQYLKKYGMEHPETGLQHKIVRVNFSEKVETRDPFTMKKIKQHIKPFMVDNLVRYFERQQIALLPTDKQMIKQFEDYHIVRWGQDGRAVYTDKNEHIHDCVLLAMHGFVVKYTDMLRVSTTVEIRQLGKLEMGGDVVMARAQDSEDDKQKSVNNFGFAVMKARSKPKGRSSGFVSRRTF